jgi:hypothetical protein
MKDWNSVDEKWREQLQNKSEDIPEGLWSRIEERLEEKPVRRFPIYWAAAAMLLLALGLSWNWNSSPEKAAEVTHIIKKTVVPMEKVAASASEPLIVASKAPESIIIKASFKPVSIEESPVSLVVDSPKEEIVAAVPVIEKKEESQEIVTVRLDIDPIMEEEEMKPTFTQQKRRKSLFGKIVGEIRQALDGEPVNWQKLKEGNPAFENNIHNVANTYIKTEENLKRTLQIQ